MSQANGFTFMVVDDAKMSILRRLAMPYAGLRNAALFTTPISRHHNDVLAERAARRLARAAHGTGQTFWIVNMSDANEHWGVESRCVGAYETRCPVCTAVLEALPDYSADYPRCSLCHGSNDSEDSVWCVACRLASGEFDNELS